MNKETKRIITEEEHYTEVDSPFTIQPTFSTLGSIIEISIPGPVITIAPDDSLGDLLGLNGTTIHEEYNLSPNPVEFLSFDNFFLECDVAQGMIFKGKRSGIILKFTMDVDPGYKYTENFRVGVQLYMTESKVFISSVCFKLKIENNQILSFNGQSITFRLTIKEI